MWVSRMCSSNVLKQTLLSNLASGLFVQPYLFQTVIKEAVPTCRGCRFLIKCHTTSNPWMMFQLCRWDSWHFGLARTNDSATEMIIHVLWSIYDHKHAYSWVTQKCTLWDHGFSILCPAWHSKISQRWHERADSVPTDPGAGTSAASPPQACAQGLPDAQKLIIMFLLGGKSIYKWMMKWGAHISGNVHMIS